MSPALQAMCISEGPIFTPASHGMTFRPLPPELQKTDLDGPFVIGSGGMQAMK